MLFQSSLPLSRGGLGWGDAKLVTSQTSSKRVFEKLNFALVRGACALRSPPYPPLKRGETGSKFPFFLAQRRVSAGI
jgi:hypothetical protein